MCIAMRGDPGQGEALVGMQCSRDCEPPTLSSDRLDVHTNRLLLGDYIRENFRFQINSQQ